MPRNQSASLLRIRVKWICQIKLQFLLCTLNQTQWRTWELTSHLGTKLRIWSISQWFKNKKNVLHFPNDCCEWMSVSVFWSNIVTMCLCSQYLSMCCLKWTDITFYCSVECQSVIPVVNVCKLYTIRNATLSSQPSIPTCALFFPCVSLEPFQLYPVKQTARRPPPYSSPGSPAAMLSHLARFPTLQPKDR